MSGGPGTPLPPPGQPGKPVVPARPKRRRWPKVLLAVGIVLAVIAAGVGVGIAVLYNKFGQITVIPVDTDKAPEPEEPINILLMGSDSRSGKGNEKYGPDAGRGGQRSDTTILLHVSGDRKSALGVSIPRDLWVEQPKCALREGELPHYDKFNNAFDVGGPACTTTLVKELTGVPVHHIAVVDFAGFKQVVDALGGVEVCLTRPVYDSAAKLDLPAGKSVVTGDTALAFVRARKSLGDGSDIGRMQRQQAFLSSAIRKVTDSQMLLNPARVLAVLDTATKALTVDQSLDTVGEMKSLVDSVRSIKPADITFTTMPFVYRDDLANVDPDPVKAAALWQAMKDDTPWPPPVSVGSDGEKLTVPPEEISVRVVAPESGPNSMRTVVADLQRAGFGVGEQVYSGNKRDVTRVVYPPGQEDAARTLAYSVDAVMVQDSDAWAVTLEAGKDWDGASGAIVVAKPKNDQPGTTGGDPTNAAEEICAG